MADAVTTRAESPENARVAIPVPPDHHRGAGPAVVVVGHGSSDPESAVEFRRFVALLAPRWPGRRVESCFLELAEPPVVPLLDELIAAGVRDMTVAPAFLLGAGHIKNDLPVALAAIRARAPAVTVRYAAPLGIETRLVRVVADRIAATASTTGPAPDTWVLLVGRGATDPDANADLYKLGRLLYEGGSWRGVECCFISLAEPSLPAGLARCVALGAKRVIVVPLLLFTGVLTRRIATQVAAEAPRYPGLTVSVAAHLGGDERLANLLAWRVAEAERGRATMTCDCCVYRAPLPGFEALAGAPQHSDHGHGLRGHDHGNEHEQHSHRPHGRFDHSTAPTARAAGIFTAQGAERNRAARPVKNGLDAT